MPQLDGLVMRQELIAAVGRAADVSPDKAALAVAAMMRFFTARLPSAVVGELHCLLEGPESTASEKAVCPLSQQPL